METTAIPADEQYWHQQAHYLLVQIVNFVIKPEAAPILEKLYYLHVGLIGAIGSGNPLAVRGAVEEGEPLLKQALAAASHDLFSD